MKPAKRADFFLGANSPEGFISYYTELNDTSLTDNCYVIKGCPGSGKSTMMKKTTEKFYQKETLTEQIHCSSDPDSLDAVILHDSRSIIADGTSPHAIEPKLPIAYETIVSLYDCFDYKKVSAQRKKAIELDKKIKEHHRRCCCYLAGASMLLEDNMRIVSDCTDYAKVLKLAQKLAQKELPDKKSAAGTERKRLLSAITPKGNLSFPQTVTNLCERIYVIKDEYSAASRALIGTLKELALKRGYDVFCCYCPLEPKNKPEHLLIPELGLGFVTQNSYIEFPGTHYRVIHFSRFTNKDKLKSKKQRLSFNKRAAREILYEAVKSLEQAKALHDDLEKIYASGVDFSKVNLICEKMQKEISKFYEPK